MRFFERRGPFDWEHECPELRGTSEALVRRVWPNPDPRLPELSHTEHLEGGEEDESQ